MRIAAAAGQRHHPLQPQMMTPGRCRRVLRCQAFDSSVAAPLSAPALPLRASAPAMLTLTALLLLIRQLPAAAAAEPAKAATIRTQPGRADQCCCSSSSQGAATAVPPPPPPPPLPAAAVTVPPPQSAPPPLPVASIALNLPRLAKCICMHASMRYDMLNFSERRSAPLT
jgi:hypothetical protein